MAATVEEPRKQRTARVDGAGLLRRTFARDVFACPRCGGRLVLGHSAHGWAMTSRLGARFGWFTGGRTLLASTFFRGTPLGHRIVAVPALRRSMGMATAAFELGAPVLLLWPGMHVGLALMAVTFHLGVLLVMRISFWHLWVFFPALFVVP
ncbi:hypothetical protein NR798_08895 [Archangium gephyra]|uniref:hypothetical protein n=1 Tax=Archangium gephyra TaxID=48 RepID=UPI0035D48A6E